MHPQQPNFKLSRQAILLGIISTAYPMTGYCVTAGRADFVIGNVVVITADGNRRILSKGSDISAGDSINTSPGARAQLRFIDGGFVSLQPNTQFRVDEFNYQNKTDGTEKGFFSLLKGGFRAITGAIGHYNRSSYKVATPSATIGIRGTGYKAEIRDDGLLVSVGEGAILLTNNMGGLLVTSGGSAYVANMNTPPAPTSEQPNTPPASIQPINNTSASIIQPILSSTTPRLVSGSGYKMAYTFSTSNNAVGAVTATFSDTGQLTQFSNSAGDSGSLGTGSVTFSATDGIIGWGRWGGNILLSTTANTLADGTQSGTLHYIIGLPTAVMPTTGTATYNLLGYTNPTASDASTGWTVKGNLSADFSTALVGVNMTVSNVTDSYAIAGQADRSGSNFTAAPSPTSTTGSCGCSCFSSINGMFVGDNASRAGLSYSITGGTQDVQGVVAFTKAP